MDKQAKKLPELKEIRKNIGDTIERLVDCEDHTPGIGLAIGGLRTALEGIDGHAQVVAAKAEVRPPTKAEVRPPTKAEVRLPEAKTATPAATK